MVVAVCSCWSEPDFSILVLGSCIIWWISWWMSEIRLCISCIFLCVCFQYICHDNALLESRLELLLNSSLLNATSSAKNAGKSTGNISSSSNICREANRIFKIHSYANKSAGNSTRIVKILSKRPNAPPAKVCDVYKINYTKQGTFYLECVAQCGQFLDT